MRRFERVVPMMTKFLSDTGLETAADAIELDALSEDLDAAMVAVLGPHLTSLSAADYGRAYRKVGRRRDRQRQINLIQHLGQSLDRLTHQRFVADDLGRNAQTGEAGGRWAICKVSSSAVLWRSRKWATPMNS